MDALRKALYLRVARKSLTPRRVLNAARAYSEFRRRSLVMKSEPVYMVIEPCSACTLRCPECVHGDNAIPPTTYGTIDVDLFRRVVDRYQRTLLVADLFNWGEPLLNKRLPELIRYCSDRRITTSIHTTLSFVKAGAAEALMRSGLDVLVASIDGATPDSYAKYRIGGNFDAAIENLATLAGLSRVVPDSPTIIWKYLVFPHNEGEVEAARARAADLGVVFHTEVGRLTDGDAPASSVIASKVGSKPERRPCHYLWSMPVVNWDGSIFPCCRLYDKSDAYAGISVDDVGFDWNNARFQESRKLFHEPAAEGCDLPCVDCHRYLSYWEKP